MRTFPTPLKATDIERLYRYIRNNQLIVVPTDTVYGIAANPWNKNAVDHLLTIKKRGREDPSPVLVSSIEQAKDLVSSLDPAAAKLMEQFWPGALTIVLPARRSLRMDLGVTNGTVAIRMPNQADLLDLLDQVGPIAVTSANLHGQPPSLTVEQAQNYFGEEVDAYVDGGASGGVAPSTIVRLAPIEAPQHLEVLRWGDIKGPALTQACGLEIKDLVK